MANSLRSHQARHGLRAEQAPELAGTAAFSGRPGALTYGEATLFASVHSSGLRSAVARERSTLDRARRRLVRARLAAADEPPPVESAPVAEQRDDATASRAAEYADGLTLPRGTAAAVTAVVVVVEFLFWWTLGRQFVRDDDHTSPEALQAVALALLFPAVVFGGARIGAALGHLSALPPGLSRRWYRYRAWSGAVLVAVMAVAMALTATMRFAGESRALGATPMPVVPLTLAFLVVPLLALAVHAFATHPEVERQRGATRKRRLTARGAQRRRAGKAAVVREWHLAAVALEARIQRVALRYQHEVAAGEAVLLGHRARYGPAEAPLVDEALTNDGPPSWLGIRVLPIRSALALSERVLREYGPPSPPTAAGTGPAPSVLTPLHARGDG